MQNIFTDVTGGSLTGSNYLEWRELYDHLSVIFDTDEEIEHYWDQFLRAFYLTSSEPGSVSRQRFYRNTGIPANQIDWDLWREIKRGTT
jgi:hypothetical protein